MEAIRSNLFANYGPRRIDTTKAIAAYRGLVERLALPYHILAIATTNYDLAAERGLSGWSTSNGRQVQYSDRLSAPYAGATRILDPVELSMMQEEFDQGDRGGVMRIPLMHLHGAVGWYLDEDDRISIPLAQDQPYQPGRRPALLLPDSEKAAYSLPGGEELWNQFRLIVNAASHIGFLGHSLHDRHIMRIVNEAPRPKNIAVFWHAPDSPARLSDEDRGHIEKSCPGAQIILGEFSPESRFNADQLEAWLAAT